VTAGGAVAQSASSIVVEGNRRVEADTVRSYFRVSPGERLDPLKADDGVKALFATGLFADVRYRWEGGRLVVTVVENSVISRIQFEGNKRVKDEQLLAEIQSKPRGSLSRPLVQADVQRIVEIYRRNGRYDIRVEPKIIDRPNNRVDLVFEITEGGKTTVKDLEFVGNRAYSAWRLRDVIKTGQSNLLSFLKNNDLYDPDRIEADRELLRRWYLKNGYADVRIVSAVAEFDQRRNGFVLTFTIEEGDRYTLQFKIRGAWTKLYRFDLSEQQRRADRSTQRSAPFVQRAGALDWICLRGHWTGRSNRGHDERRIERSRTELHTGGRVAAERDLHHHGQQRLRPRGQPRHERAVRREIQHDRFPRAECRYPADRRREIAGGWKHGAGRSVTGGERAGRRVPLHAGSESDSSRGEPRHHHVARQR
jgi:hypothetical protein